MIAGLYYLAYFARTGFALAREGALGLVDISDLPPSARMLIKLGRMVERKNAGDDAARLSAAFTRLGPSYVKVGQFLATRPDLVGFKAARDLERLQDRLPPFPQDEAVRTVEAAIGKPLHDIFDEFSDPIAAASVAQVHRAHIKGAPAGQWVAVKIVRPGVRGKFARDLQAMRYAANVFDGLSADARRYRAPEVAETLSRSVAFEMDLRLEAAALSELSANIAEDEDFRTPKPDWDLTARDVLTTEWIDGIRLSDLAAIDAAGHDRKALAQTVLQSFLRHAIRDGFFHADMHPGNLFVDPQGRLAAVDFGIMGRLGLKDRRFLAEILYGFITRDYRRVAEVHFEAGYVPAHHSVDDFAQAIRAVGEPIQNRRADEISMAKVLTLLFEITSLFEMQTRTELVMLQKTMVVVEGVARTLDPRIDIWKTSEPVIKSWIGRELGPIGRIERAKQGMLTLADLASDLPDLARRAERLFERTEEIARKGLPLDAESMNALGSAKSQGNKGATTALWFIAFALIVIMLRML